MCASNRLIAGLLLSFILAFGAAPASGSDEAVDWARWAPGDTGFYVELHGLAEIRARFRDLGIWEAVQRLHNGGEPTESSKAWQHRTKELLGFDIDATITEILGRRAAIIAATSDGWSRGVVLAEIDTASHVQRLLRAWRATATGAEGGVERFAIPGGLTVAVLGRTLAIGPVGDPEGLWSRTVLLMSGSRGPALASRSEFAALRSVSLPDASGILYTAWAPGDPMAVAGCRRLLVSFRVEPAGVRAELYGLLDAGAPQPPAIGVETAHHAPASSLAVWTGSINVADLCEGKDNQARRVHTVAGFVLGTMAAPMGEADLLSTLGPECTWIVGRDPAAKEGNFDLPAVTIICEAGDSKAVAARLDLVMPFFAKVAYMTARTRENWRQIDAKTSRCGDTAVRSVPLGPALSDRLGLSFLAPIEPAWAALDGSVLVSTSLEHARQVIRARRPPDGAEARQGRCNWPPEDESDLGQSLWLRGRDMSEMLAAWLKWIETHRPEALQDAWWKRWAAAQVAQRAELGVGLGNDSSKEGRAVVYDFREGSPADGHLFPGDVILAIGDEEMTGSDAARRVAEKYRTRGPRRVFDLRVRRGDETVNVSIPVLPQEPIDLHSFDPIRAIRQLVELARNAESVRVRRYVGQPGRLHARIEIDWTTSGAARPPG